MVSELIKILEDTLIFKLNAKNNPLMLMADKLFRL